MKDEKLTGGHRELCFRVTKDDRISDPEAGRVSRQGWRQNQGFTQLWNWLGMGEGWWQRKPETRKMF